MVVVSKGNLQFLIHWYGRSQCPDWLWGVRIVSQNASGDVLNGPVVV